MKTAKPLLHTYDTPAQLHDALALRVADDLAEAIDQKGFATLMLSGGNTPRPFLQKLAAEPILWEKVRISLVDERWVDPASEKSNEKMVRSTLLQSGAKKASFYGMHDDIPNHKALQDFNALLRSKLYPFDVVILGLGTDGHTASLFPNRPELAALLDLSSERLCGFCEAPVEPKERMTLSLAAIASAAHCYLHIEGSEKLAVYRKALEGSDPAAMPIRAVFNACGEAVETFYA